MWMMTANILNFYVYFNTVFQIQFQDGLDSEKQI